MEQMNTATNNQQEILASVEKRNAYHQAGHAVAIYVRNKQKQLPAVHFQIIVKPQGTNGQHLDQHFGPQMKYTAKVEGGRLVHSLPLSLAGRTENFSWHQQAEFRRALEADVINLLAGYLAEAKYVAIQDNEVISANLMNFTALQFYGGDLDIDSISEYMECLFSDISKREKKLSELFLAAYNFINKRPNWLAITALAEFIRKNPSNTINCQEIIDILKSRKAA